MPRLTEASRRARREAIADAAIEVFERRGVAHASTADIIEALGGSAGGVYSHFNSKSELIRYIAQRVLTESFTAVVPVDSGVHPPKVILRAALASIADRVPAELIVQLWGEATIDPEMRLVVLETLDRVEVTFAAAMLSWARTSEGDPHARAARAARAVRTITQSYIVQLALRRDVDAESHLDEFVALLTTES